MRRRRGRQASQTNLIFHLLDKLSVFMSFVTCGFNQSDEKAVKKEPSRDEEENEDDGSTANAEEYDPMEAEDAEDDDDDGTMLFFSNAQPKRLLLMFPKYDLVNDEKSCTTLSL